MVTERHCENLEQHTQHSYLHEWTSQRLYGETSGAYYCNCWGTTQEEADFAKWCQENMEQPFSGWELQILMTFAASEREEIKNTVELKKGRKIS